MKKIYSILVISSMLTISCEDNFTEQKPIGSFSETVLNTPEGIKMALIGAYSPLNGDGDGRIGEMNTGPGQIVFGSIRGGEAHKGSSPGDHAHIIDIMKYAVNANNYSLDKFFTIHYDAIFRTNKVLALLPFVEGLTAEESTQIMAEARFLRGHYHFLLKRLFKNIPFLDESSLEDPRIPNTDEAGNYVDSWPAIAEDFKFAADNLTPTNSNLGSVNKWAAKAYYAKTLLYIGNENDNSSRYSEAKSVFDEVIANGVTNKGERFALNADYHANFNNSTENSPEAVFAVQHVVNDGSADDWSNGSLDLQFISPQGGNGPGDNSGYGFFNPSQWFVNHFRVDAAGLPIFDDATRNADFIKSDDGLEAGSQGYVPDQGLIDPRLDWSVGRRGIPFLDYGLMPGKSWIRDQSHSGPYLSKKFFTTKESNGTAALSGRRSMNDLNISVIRFADVLLMAAEVEARLGNIEQARVYVNEVRNRMATNTASPNNWVHNGSVPAAHYKIGLYSQGAAPFNNSENALKAIFFERTLELGLEGHRAYDAIRFGAADGKTDAAELNGFITYESSLKGYLSGGNYSQVPDAVMPIPQKAIDNSFKDGKTTLKQSPGY